MAETSGTKPPSPEREKAANEAGFAVERRQRRSLRRARICEELQFVKAVAIILAYYAVAIWYYRNEEQWSMIDCVYFAVVTCTSIGYGDLVPSSDTSKGFTIGFAFAGVLGVLFAIQIIGEWMAAWQSKLTAAANRRMLRATQEAADRNKSRQHERKDPAAKGYNKKLEALKTATANTSRVTSVAVLWCTSCWRGCAARASRLDQWLLAHGGHRWGSARKVIALVLEIVIPIVAYLSLGAFLGPFEGWTTAESFYFSSITMLSIGYGDLVPTTQSGRLFCIFYIPMAVGVLFKTFTTMKAFRLRARTQKVTLKAILMMDEDFDGKVSEAEFMRGPWSRPAMRSATPSGAILIPPFCGSPSAAHSAPAGCRLLWRDPRHHEAAIFLPRPHSNWVSEFGGKLGHRAPRPQSTVGCPPS